MNDSKAWYTSKTLWVNAIGLVALGLQLRFGWVVSPEYQAMALGVVNGILRVVTKQELTA